MATRLSSRLERIEHQHGARDRLAYLYWWLRFTQHTPEAVRLSLRLHRAARTAGVAAWDLGAQEQLHVAHPEIAAWDERIHELARLYIETTGDDPGNYATRARRR